MNNLNKKGHKVLKAGIGYTVGNILIKGINFLTIPIFTRLLSTTDYGMFNTYAAFESMLFVIVGLCLHSSLKNAKYDYKDDYKQYTSNNIFLSMISCFSFVIILNLLYPVFSQLFGFSRLILNILIFHSYGTALINFYNQQLALEYKYKVYLLISFINIVANLSLSLLLIHYIFNTTRWFARIIGTAVPIIMIGLTIIFINFRAKRPKANIEHWKYSLKICLPIIPHGLSQIILTQFDRIMVKRIISAAAAGLYSFSYNISSILSTITVSLETVWSPFFFEKMNEKKYDDIKIYYKKYVSLVTMFFAMVIFSSNEIVHILGDKAYWESITTVYPLIIATFFAFIYYFPANVEYYYKKNKYIAIGTTMAAVINIVLNFIFIRKFGYIAAAYTTMVSYALYFIFHYYIYTKITKVKLFNLSLFIIKTLQLICFAIICMINTNIFIRLALAILYLIIFIYNNRDYIKQFLKK